MSRNDVLVTVDWVQDNLGQPGIVFVEVDEDTSAYDGGHIEGAVKLDWKQDLQDPLRRDYLDKTAFEALLSSRGIANDDTVVLYGGNNNWFAAYAYWYFKLYGHRDVKLIDGGRKKWELDARPLTKDAVSRPATQYTAQEPDLTIRAFRGHFTATELGQSGTPVATISARLGHRDKATTLNIYSHTLPATDALAAETISRLIGAPRRHAT